VPNSVRAFCTHYSIAAKSVMIRGVLMAPHAYVSTSRSAGVRAGERDGDPGGHGANGLPTRRQLRHHLGHRQQRVLLRRQRDGHPALLAGHADALVPGPPPHPAAGRPGRRAGGAGRDRRERLQLRLLARGAARPGAHVDRAGRGGQAGRRRGGAHRHGRPRVRGAREPALRVRAAVPAPVPRRGEVLGVRPQDGVPRLVQPVRRVPQPPAQRPARCDTPAPPGRHHRLRRLVRRHDEHLPGPRQARYVQYISVWHSLTNRARREALSGKAPGGS
jgi:hypothetical protein